MAKLYRFAQFLNNLAQSILDSSTDDTAPAPGIGGTRVPRPIPKFNFQLGRHYFQDSHTGFEGWSASKKNKEWYTFLVRVFLGHMSLASWRLLRSDGLQIQDFELREQCFRIRTEML